MGAPSYDVIVIGAGHNGLVTAGILARAGRKVLVLERRPLVGGMCAGEEFHPGFRTAGLLHDTAQLRLGLVEALRLDECGLELEPIGRVLVPEENGPGLVLSGDDDATAGELSRLSPHDAARWRDYRAFLARVRPVVEPLLNEAPPDLMKVGTPEGRSLAHLARRGLALRRLGRAGMAELLRVPPMCVADWLNEYFEHDLVKGALAHAALLGTWAGPWSPGTAANLLLLECTAAKSIHGGASALVAALERSVREAGAEIRTGADVRAIRLDAGAAAGVVLADAGEISARMVAASCDPRTLFLDLIPPAGLPVAFEHRVGVIRSRGTSAKVHLALNRPLEFASRPGERVERARTSGSLDDLERSFDAVKYGGFSDRPLLDVHVPTVSRPELAPLGSEVVSILAHFAPHDLPGGWTPAARERLGDAVVAELCRYAPSAASSLVAREVLTPVDIALRYRASGGHIHHVEHALDQLLVRPTIDTMRFHTPVRGLFLCGSGAHPGGGVTGAPGALAAAAILRHR